jgi:NAD(P)-dependent dehydrogenase (short-subunit alcohol dehydrogenase family)
MLDDFHSSEIAPVFRMHWCSKVMDLGLKNKTILVTAASRGLGYGAAKALVEEGAEVIICGRTEESLKTAIASLGPNSQYFVADVSKSGDITELIGHVKQVTSKLDGLLVNAGVTVHSIQHLNFSQGTNPESITLKCNTSCSCRHDAHNIR